MSHNLPYAHDHPPLGFLEAIDAIRPQVLIGATGAPGTFTQPVIERLSEINSRPFSAPSNPTSRAECTPEQAYAWSGGRAIFASGSPFAPVLRGHAAPPGARQQCVRLPRHRVGGCRAPRPHAARRAVPRGRAHARESGAEEDLDEGALYPPREIRRSRGRSR